MKRSILVLAACLAAASANALSLRGNGKPVDSERAVKNFTGVAFSSSGQVRIQKGTGFKVTVRLDSNLQDAFEAKVSGGILILGFKSGTSVTNLTELAVTITMPELSSVGVSGDADISVGKGFSGSGFKADISGTCDFSAAFGHYDEMEFSLSGTGDFSLEGGAKRLSIRVSGSGEFDARGLEAETAEISISGMGDVELSVSKELKASISGMGTITYYGSPSVKQSISGMGKVIKG